MTKPTTDAAAGTYEYALVPVSATEYARVPLPTGHTDAQRAAYLANPPKDILAAADRWPRVPALQPEAPAAEPTTTPHDGKE